MRAQQQQQCQAPLDHAVPPVAAVTAWVLAPPQPRGRGGCGCRRASRTTRPPAPSAGRPCGARASSRRGTHARTEAERGGGEGQDGMGDRMQVLCENYAPNHQAFFVRFRTMGSPYPLSAVRNPHTSLHPQLQQAFEAPLAPCCCVRGSA